MTTYTIWAKSPARTVRFGSTRVKMSAAWAIQWQGFASVEAAQARADQANEDAFTPRAYVILPAGEFPADR